MTRLNPTSTVLSNLSGTYQRKSGQASTYAYVATYGVNSEGTWWTATIRCKGQLKGTPMGTLEQVRETSKHRITELIEHQIEYLDQVAE